MNDVITNIPDLELAYACAESDVPGDGAIITRTLSGRSIALARKGEGCETIVAFDSRCPHKLAPLRFGRVASGEVVCPWHFFRFDLKTGETVTCPESIMHLEIFPVIQRGGEVFVQIDRPLAATDPHRVTEPLSGTLDNSTTSPRT